MLRLKARIGIAAGAELGEGPVLFPDGGLRWVDLLEGEIYELRGGHNGLLAKFDHEVSKVLPWRGGSLVLGREHVLALDASGKLVGSAKLHSTESNLRCSDASVLPDGSIAVGVVERDLKPGAGRLLQITRDWQILELVSEATISNGIAMHPSANFAIWIDSPTQQLYRLDWIAPTKTLGVPREFASVPAEYGVPDGLCFDRDGGCWVAIWGGGTVLRFNESGRIDAVVELPVANVTSCAFDALDNLIITSAAVTLTSEERKQSPGAGGIWLVPAAAHGRQGVDVGMALLETPSSDLVAD